METRAVSTDILLSGIQLEFFLTLKGSVGPDAVTHNVSDDQISRAMEAARKAAREVAKELEK